MAKGTKGSITYRPDSIVKDEYGPGGLTKGQSGVLTPEAGEARVECPKCGSPHLAQFNGDTQKYGAELPGFTCLAGDCGYVGAAKRRAA